MRNTTHFVFGHSDLTFCSRNWSQHLFLYTFTTVWAFLIIFTEKVTGFRETKFLYDLSEPAEISLLSDVGVLEIWIKLHYHYPDKIVSLMKYLAPLSVQKSDNNVSITKNFKNWNFATILCRTTFSTFYFISTICSIKKYLYDIFKWIDIKEASGPVVRTWEIKWNLSNQHLR